MFKKVLIANRGAIATRIIRTLRKLNVAAVAVYAEADRDSLHVHDADESHSLGDGAAKDTYLDSDKILAIARKHEVEAIHPGYGFLSENADFVRACEAAGIAFIGPTARQITDFGLKHRARELAIASNLALSPGTGLLPDIAAARAAAEKIGYPVMLKTTAGGGGIGMRRCADAVALDKAYQSIRRLGGDNFANDGVFLEKWIARARHIEVQVFGDGRGKAVALGERDCSSQRRNQKVVEECPAPGLDARQREVLHQTAARLLASVDYRNAGTVEFIYDETDGAFYFLEVNTRLQVEHGVSEEVYGIDLVEWMVRLCADELGDIEVLRRPIKPSGHAIQARIYAEDPYKHFQPCPGFFSQVHFPQGEGVRVDHWLSQGMEIPADFDPMLAKVIVKADTREAAVAKMIRTLADIRLYGSETNLGYLKALFADEKLQSGTVTTDYLDTFAYHPARIDVLAGGIQSTIQDLPGRRGYWAVGVPPSGPFDTLSFRLGNRLLGNPQSAAGLEMTVSGPSLKFSVARRIVIAGADIAADLDGAPLPLWQVIQVGAGQVLKFGRIATRGANSYLLIEGGLDCPDHLGAKATFTLGALGGHNGRALRCGDVLHLNPGGIEPVAERLPTELVPVIGNEWTVRVTCGPHGAPDYFTAKDIDTFFAATWEVHHDSNRSGVRLIGPKPEWAREDGGEAGLHPSNIHDNAYAFGTMDFTGDMPILLGPDGPSLGGFVCPMTVITADLWKIGQLRAGDKVSFEPVSVADARQMEADQLKGVARLQAEPTRCVVAKITSPILRTLDDKTYGDRVVYRVAGDHFLLIEYGAAELALRLRFRVHALMQWLERHPLDAVIELTPGIRSLQVHYDSQKVDLHRLLDHMAAGERHLAASLETMTVPSRTVHLPLSWDDEACRKAITLYDRVVRKNAPWYPSNLEFIRRINGLDSIDQVRDIVFDAEYLVMGLGDVYLGAPVATPIDPRARLVTTKYNPARTWTAENAVGIGGSYLCVYGMEGPGGYQFVGRTVQMWNRYRKTTQFSEPHLLRFFDRLKFYPVSNDKLLRIRRDFPRGGYALRIEEGVFSLREHLAFMTREHESITAFRDKRNAAFDAELARWHRDGQFRFESPQAQPVTERVQEIPADCMGVESPVTGSVWKVTVAPGQRIAAGDTLLILEAMKMEIPVAAESAGEVVSVAIAEGRKVKTGDTLIVIREAAG